MVGVWEIDGYVLDQDSLEEAAIKNDPQISVTYNHNCLFLAHSICLSLLSHSSRTLCLHLLVSLVECPLLGSLQLSREGGKK
jgi:hypothetical protein